MSLQESLKALESVSYQFFSDWRNTPVPRIAAGVYTIWDQSRFIYVGMSGRGMITDDVDAPDEPMKTKGLWTRLNSHASGRRSGGQFCVYICERFVVPALSSEQQAQIGDGALSIDALTRKYFHDHLAYRYVTVGNGAAAYELERGAVPKASPLLWVS